MSVGAPIVSNSGIASSSVPRNLTVSLPMFSGNKVAIVVLSSARTTTATGWFITVPTWNGVPMVEAEFHEAALNGFGLGKVMVSYLAIGDVVNLSASANQFVTTSESQASLMFTVLAYANVDQATPLNDVNSDDFISAASSLALSVNSDPSDRVVQSICFAATSASGASPTSGQTKVTGIDTTIGSPTAHVAGDDEAEAGATTDADWDSFTSSWSAAIASLVSAGAIVPVISDVNGGSTVNEMDTDLTVNGTDFDPPGTTALYYADDSVFATATKQVQSISAVTDTTINWDSIDLGSIGLGANFLFVVTDEGGAEEAVSAAFALTVEETPLVPLAFGGFGCCKPHINGMASGDVVHSIVNVGGFAEIYINGTGPNPFELRTIGSSDVSISVVQSTNDLDFKVTATGLPSEVFQTDSTSTLMTSSTSPVTWVTLAGTADMLENEEWKVNMDLLVCNPLGDTWNTEMFWQIETSAGVFTEFDKYSNHAGLTISGLERSMPIARTKNLLASMDAPRMRIQVRRTGAGSAALWELPRWGGIQIEVAP